MRNWKRIRAAVMAAVVCIVGLHTIPVQSEQTQQAAYIVYVSPDGRQDAAGTLEDPFATLEEAKEYMRTQKPDADSRGLIYLREGVYQASSDNPSVELDSRDSYVTYAAYQNEAVTMTGTTVLDNEHFHRLSEVSGEQYSSQSRLPDSVKDKVYVYDLGAEHIPTGAILKNGFNWPKQTFQPELMVNGQLQTLAQYPNGDTKLSRTQILAGKAKKTSDENADTAVAKAAGANEGERPRNYWFDKTDTPKSYEEMLIMKGPVFYTQNGLEEEIAGWAPPTVENEPQDAQTEPHVNTDHTRYETDGWLSGYFENNYANDMCRIYSVDTASSTIHCKYPSLQGVQDKRIRLKAINLLCELDTEGEYYIDRYNDHDVLYFYPEGGSIGEKDVELTSFDGAFFELNQVTGVKLEGITFTGTTGNGVTMADCEDCVIEACEFSNISMDAVKIGDHTQAVTADPSYQTMKGGHRNTVRECVIHDMGCGGVYLAGGDEQTLERGNNVVEHCEFYNISRLQTYTPAVYLEGCGNTARYNEIHDAPHMVIQIMGNDMLVTHNHIYDVCTNTSDQAPIYSGRCFNWLGNEVSYNLIENVPSGCYGVYMDDGMSGMIIKNNIFNNVKGTAVFSNNGFGHQITDNVFVNTKTAISYKKYGGSRPIANEKVLAYRYYRVLREGDGTNYTNTAENIAKWYAHYEKLYPFLGEKYFPQEDDAGWNTDARSVFVPADQILKRMVIVGRGTTTDTSAVSGLQDDQFQTGCYTAADLSEIGLDLETGKFDSSSVLSRQEEYGQEWITSWNESFTLDNIGITDKNAPTASDAPLPSATPELPEESQIPEASEQPQTSQQPLIAGDVNMDGAVTLEDAQIALRAALRITGLDAQQLQRADVDGEKGITLKDAQMILRAALRIEALQES